MEKSFLFVLLLCLLSTGTASAYPPNNAAVIYYRQAEFFSIPEDKTWNQIRNLGTSNDPVSEETKDFMKSEKTAYLLQDLQIASEIEFCDWGLDFSQGFAMQMPILNQMKNFYHLLLADSAIQASEGNISESLAKNLVARRIASHVTNDTLIGHLMSCNMNQGCNKALNHLLCTYPLEKKTLIELKNELLWKNYLPKSFCHSLMMEKEICLLEISNMTPERYMEVTGWAEEDKELTKRVVEYLKNIDPNSRERSIELFSKYYDDIFTLLEKPYKQAYEGITAKSKQICKEAEENEDALLPSIFLPALSKCYSLSIGWKTNCDAMLTALDVYILAAKNGKLPTELPQSSYIDHFSGKPFIYEITDDGFTLRCQQEDLDKKEVHEFHYKLPK